LHLNLEIQQLNQRLTFMYKPRPLPVLTGAAAERFHRMMTDGSFHEDKDYSQAWADYKKIMEHSAEFWK